MTPTAVPSRSRPFGATLITLTIAMLLLVVVEVCLLVASPGPVAILLTFPLVGSLYAIAGVLAWSRRPRSRVGLLLVVGGLGYLLAGLGNTTNSGLVLIGDVFATVPFAVIVHLLLAFPSGQLRTPIDRGLAAIAYVNSLVLQAPQYLLAEVASESPTSSALSVVAAGARVAQRWIGVLVVLTVAVVLIRRLTAARPRQRRVLAPLYAYGVVTVLSIPLSHALSAVLGISPLSVFLCQVVALAGLPIAFSGSVIRGGFARSGELNDLAEWLGSDVGTRPRMVSALAGTLGDPSLQVTFEGDPASRPAGSSPAPATDGIVDVELAGRRVARIRYDPVLLPDREQVQAAARIVAIEVDRERLTAELVDRTRQLEQSRVRLLEAQDAERRRIAADLHDGLQSQLVLLSMRANLLARAEQPPEAVSTGARELHRDLDLTAREVRRLVHGLMPALLTERGLFAAAEDLADTLPFKVTLHTEGSDRRLPAAVETTIYYVVSEALTNAVKHSGARRLGVALWRHDDHVGVEVQDDGAGGADLGAGTGLSGIADRVDVLGGTLTVDSPVGRGTTLVARVPCVGDDAAQPA